MVPPTAPAPRMTNRMPLILPPVLVAGSPYRRRMTVLDDARAMSDDLVQLRRRLHQHPEVGLDLPWTQEAVLAAIDGLPLDVSTGTSLSSVTAVLRGGSGGGGGSGRAVLLRGDMDALPVQERTGL